MSAPAPSGSRRCLAAWKTEASRVWRLLAPGTRLVLEARARFGNASGRSYPSTPTLAEECGCDRATVIRADKQAVAIGILVRGERVPRKGERGLGTVQYRFAPAPTTAAALEEAIRVARSLRGRQGRGRLPRWGLRGNVASKSRDQASGRFTPTLRQRTTFAIEATGPQDPSYPRAKLSKPPPGASRSGDRPDPLPAAAPPPDVPRRGKPREAGLQNAPPGRERDVAEIAQALRLQERGRWAEYLGTLLQLRYPGTVVEAGLRLAEDLERAWPGGALGETDGASPLDPRVPEGPGSPGSGAGDQEVAAAIAWEPWRGWSARPQEDPR